MAGTSPAMTTDVALGSDVEIRVKKKEQKKRALSDIKSRSLRSPPLSVSRAFVALEPVTRINEPVCEIKYLGLIW